MRIPYEFPIRMMRDFMPQALEYSERTSARTPICYHKRLGAGRETRNGLCKTMGCLGSEDCDEVS
jgi:hypothetical protein